MIYYVLPQIEFNIKNKNLKLTFNNLKTLIPISIV